MKALIEEVAGVLERTADRLERTGWQRGDNGPKEGPNCIQGAMLWEAAPNADRSRVDDLHLFIATSQRFRREVGIDSLTQWNDKFVKDKRVITRALRRTARKLRAGTLT